MTESEWVHPRAPIMVQTASGVERIEYGPVTFDELSTEEIALFHKAKNIKKTWDRCLVDDCQQRAINAHSISKSQVLSKIAIDGHVIVVNENMNLSGNRRVVRDGEVLIPKGVNQALTFSGICAPHDQKLFNKIDKAPIKITDDEYLFLLAYRTCLQSIYSQVSLLHLDGPHIAEHNDMLVDDTTWRMMAFARLTVYKLRLEGLRREQEWGGLMHKVIECPQMDTTIVASGFVSLDDLPSLRNSKARMVFHILPHQGATVVVFSSLREHYQELLAYLSRNLSAPPGSTRFKNELSVLVLRDMENFAISPSRWNELSRLRRAQIGEFFTITAADIVDRAHGMRKITFWK